MLEQIRNIAARIRDLREIAGKSLDVAAREVGVASELYAKYESGELEIPVSIMYEISLKNNVELTEILTGEAPTLSTWCYVRKGAGADVERVSKYKYQSLAHNFARKKAEPFIVTVAPEGEDVPFHLNAHPGQEFNYVIEGTLKIIINGRELVLSEGDSLYFDSSSPHGMKAVGSEPAKFIAIIM
ncbi:MAG: cupin domain-containing protein [Clostridiales bacterium]|jgi:quercetin dioxygenase-like cupin family protein|nr:cupin domain-containing protein [Clostridiales bacterium]